MNYIIATALCFAPLGAAWMFGEDDPVRVEAVPVSTSAPVEKASSNIEPTFSVSHVPGTRMRDAEVTPEMSRLAMIALKKHLRSFRGCSISDPSGCGLETSYRLRLSDGSSVIGRVEQHDNGKGPHPGISLFR